MIELGAIKGLPLLRGATSRDAALEVLINPEHQVYLCDHRYNDKMLMPGTMIMEYFAEAAIWFTNRPGAEVLYLSGMENFDIRRSLALEKGETLTARIQLRSVVKSNDGLAVDLVISSPRINSRKEVLGERVNATCTVLFTNAPRPGRTADANAAGFDWYGIEKRSLYDYFFFPSHGPLFQSLTGRFAISRERNTLVGEYDCQGLESRFLHADAPEFVLSPLGYDSTLQYAVFLSYVKMPHSRLPVGARKVEFFDPHPRAGACGVIVECVSLNEEIMEANLSVFDADRRLNMYAEGVRLQRMFGAPKRVSFDAWLDDHKRAPFIWEWRT